MTTEIENSDDSPPLSPLPPLSPHRTTSPFSDPESTASEVKKSNENYDQELAKERLSSDLALFISNPSLSAKLSDGSLDLASYSSIVESELSTLEKECIDIYREKAVEIVELREEIDNCDGVLASLQEMLLGFQADLGGLSGDIRALQEQSRTLGTKLRNRRDAERGLRRVLERVVVPPSLADVICSGDVDATYLACVEELNSKLEFIDQDEVEEGLGVRPVETLAGTEMREHIVKLRVRAAARIREYFLGKMGELRKAKTNVRMIQVNSLLKYSALNEFLAEVAPDLHSEVREVYIESMSKTLHALFRTYQAQLSRLDSNVASRNDLIAVEAAALRDVFSSKVNLSKRTDTFFLGNRADALDQAATAQRPLLAHVAVAEKKTFPYEVLFRSVMQHLMDAATNEFVFLKLFFHDTSNHAFHLIFARTFSSILEHLENYLFNAYDCLGLLLMVKLTHTHRRIMHKRQVYLLDPFFDKLTILLWPRLKMIMDNQLRAIRSANATKLGGVDLHAHYVSRRYAEFTASILLILNKGKKHHMHEKKSPNDQSSSQPSTPIPQLTKSTSLPDAHRISQELQDQQQPTIGATAPPPSPILRSTSLTSNNPKNSAADLLMHDLTLLMEETILLLQRLSSDLPSNKHKIVFLINNLDQIICIFQERRVMGKGMTRFMDLLMKQRELFVEEELLQTFSSMISFVQQTETQLSTKPPNLDVNATVVESLVRDFSHSWKKGIEQINKNVLSYFSNFRNGMEILKQVLTQLLLYYTRFQDIIRKVWRSKPPAFCKDLVSTSVILAEIKKYALAI